MSRSTKRFWLYGIIILLIGSAIGIYKIYKDDFLSFGIPKKIKSESEGLYKITYDTIVVDEIGGSIIVNNISVQADTNRIRNDSLTDEDPSVIVNLEADSLRIFGVESPRALLTNEISGRKVLIKGVSVQLYRLRKKKKESGIETESDIIEQISYDVLKRLNLVKMDTISLENVDLSVIDHTSNKLLLKSINVSISLFDFLIDKNSSRDKSRILFSKIAETTIDSIQIPDSENRYNFRFTGLKINTGQRLLSLQNALIQPVLGEEAFVKQFKYQRDRFNFAINNISIKGIDPYLLSKGQLSADSLIIDKSSFRIYRDLTMPRDKVNRVGQYPHQVIMKVPFPLEIRKAVFKNSLVEYREKNDKTKKVGAVRFNRVTAKLNNITNNRGAISKNNMLTIDFEASFLDMAPAKVRMSLRLGDEQGRFTVKGTLAGFDASRLNVLTEPMGLARIEDGTVKSIRFDMQGDNYNGNGNLVLLYEKLKISSLKQEDNKSGYKRKGFESLIANVMVKNKNPSNGETRTGNMKNQRNTNRSFFNLVWKSIFAGVKETVGMNSGNDKADTKQEDAKNKGSKN
jgi:hypothetical protein